MTNPTPRPALRKAEDATVHPAAPRPARSPRPAASTTATKAAPALAAEPDVASVVEAEPAPATPARGKKKRKFGGATSDHLRMDEAPGADAEPEAPARPSKRKAQESTRNDLMQGKPVDVDVEVPKALRKAAAKRAKSEGLDLQTVVIDLLHGYVIRPGR
jgi:hypothetical protein